MPDEVLETLIRQDDPKLFCPMTPEQKANMWKNVPPELSKVLRPFQRTGVEFMWEHKDRGMISDEMGLGKTIQAITHALSTTDIKHWPILIVAPRTVRYTWQQEWIKWCPGATEGDVCLLKDTKLCERLLPLVIAKQKIAKASPVPVEIQKPKSLVDQVLAALAPQPSKACSSKAGSSKKRKAAKAEKDDESSVLPVKKKRVSKQEREELEDRVLSGCNFTGKIFVISYQLLIRPKVLALLEAVKFPALILDESHSAKHLTSQRTKACLKLSTFAKRVTLLSGTPASRPAELYPQLKIIHPWIFDNFWTPYPKHIKSSDAARAYKPKKFSYVHRYCDPKPIPCKGPRGVICKL